MSKKKPVLSISEAEVRAVYAQGEDAMVELVMALVECIAKLEARVEELEGRGKKKSHNSSKPPTSDGFGKKTKSLRGKSQNKSGGQPEHPGSTLEWSSEVDEIIVHEVKECKGCGADLQAEEVAEVFARQVKDVPPIELIVTEHQVEVKVCPHCQTKNQAEFPEIVTNVMQYGPRLKSMMMYLMEVQLLPSARTCEILNDVMGVDISEGTLFNTRKQCFEELAASEEEIKAEIITSEVVHFDETGLRVNGKLWWLHVACTDGLTYYFVHTKRGSKAMDEMGILPQFEGNAIHDGLKSYAGYNCEHYLCNAHHLRELMFIWENRKQSWALQMIILLCSIKVQVDEAREKKKPIKEEELRELEGRYQVLLDEGFKDNPLSPPPSKKKKGRQKQTYERNLLDRLEDHRESVLGFMYDFDIPFDNNQAERDIRMMKLKQKISGTFRSTAGAQMFCRIRSYVSTVRKQGLNIFAALISIFSGSPQSPIPQPE